MISAVALVAAILSMVTGALLSTPAAAISYQDWPTFLQNPARTNATVDPKLSVANAPTRRFFVADRQSGPVLLKYAPEHIKEEILPRICKGEICFAIGMSEPNSGSDLFAAKTRATKTDGGYLINGTKIWTSSAHIADYMIAIFRTSPATKENRRHGLTQFLVDQGPPQRFIQFVRDSQRLGAEALAL